MTYEDPTTADMKVLHKTIEEIRKLYPRMELGQLSILLLVLSDPGMRAGELVAKVGLKKSALSRNVKALTQASYLTDESGDPRQGLDLITQIPDSFDGRAFQLAPTKRGRALAENISSIMRGTRNGT
jgi:DNA-binding MarR family transcriptional regulator